VLITRCSGATSSVAEVKLFSLNTKKTMSSPYRTRTSPARATGVGTEDQAMR
jgi:hypothetical protein